MEKTYLRSFALLGFCGAAVDFMVCGSMRPVFPRDRILHIFISAAASFAVVYIIQNIDFSKGVIKQLTALAITARILTMTYSLVQYFHLFHGSNTLAILLCAVGAALLVYNMEQGRILQLYSFFMAVNVVFVLLILLLCAGKLKVSNIYANDVSFSFSVSELFLFADLLTLAALIPKGKGRIYAQNRYIAFSALFILCTTLLQGLCVRGDLLYSISPLQSLFQIYSGNTIKRFDYFMAIIQTINYFGAVILYVLAMQKLFKPQKGCCCEKG